MQVFKDLDKLSHAAADEFIHFGNAAIADHGRFNVALSGGSTPKLMFQLLASPEYRDQIDWKRIHVFWSDERYVPNTDSQSNEHMAREALLSHVEIPEANIRGMYREGGVESAAEAYDVVLGKELGEQKKLDLTLLGIGPDGHTASLFPGEPAVRERSLDVVAGIGHAGVAERITMTPPMINRSTTVMFLVAGSDKAAPMKRILHGPENWEETPSQAIARHAPHIIWLLDEQAAAE